MCKYLRVHMHAFCFFVVHMKMRSGTGISRFCKACVACLRLESSLQSGPCLHHCQPSPGHLEKRLMPKLLCCGFLFVIPCGVCVCEKQLQHCLAGSNDTNKLVTHALHPCSCHVQPIKDCTPLPTDSLLTIHDSESVGLSPWYWFLTA